jgi:hypothetical protein
MAQEITYYTTQSYIDSGYCMELVEKLKTVADTSEKNRILLELIQFSNFEQSRICICRAGICDFICDMLCSEKSIECIVNMCVLIGHIGTSDKYRPFLFSNNVAPILVRALEVVDTIDDKIKIVKSINHLCQTTSNGLKLIEAGMLSHLCDVLKIVHTDAHKECVSHAIFWVSFLTHNRTTAVECGCIEWMYNALKNISNKSIQSQILTDMKYFIRDKPDYSRYPIYALWRTDFQTYLKS